MDFREEAEEDLEASAIEARHQEAGEVLVAAEAEAFVADQEVSRGLAMLVLDVAVEALVGVGGRKSTSTWPPPVAAQGAGMERGAGLELQGWSMAGRLPPPKNRPKPGYGTGVQGHIGALQFSRFDFNDMYLSS